MDVVESVVLEELMGSISNVVFDSCYSAHDLSSGTQVSVFSESFKTDFLSSQWIFFVIVSTEDLNFLELSTGELHFDELTLPFRLDHLTGDLE